jgi:hypothetical protein
MVENKLNIVMNDLIEIKHELHVLKFPRCQPKLNNGVGSISSSTSGHDVYISEDEEMGDAYIDSNHYMLFILSSVCKDVIKISFVILIILDFWPNTLYISFLI